MTSAADTDEELPDLQGRVVAGRFRLVRRLDTGGFGEVYEAADQKIPNRRVAVKLGMAVASERTFTREAQLLGQLHQDNIVKVYDYGVEEGRPYIVMDLLVGERLDQLAAQHGGRLPRALMIKFVTEVGIALSHAHKHNLVHRDLKPKNIMLVDTGSVDDHGTPLQRFVLLDFGIASKIDATDSLANKTMAGAGTPEYMSPEQIGCLETTSATDVYTFGVLIYQMLTGRVPFPMNGGSHGAIAMVITSILNDPPPGLSTAAPDLFFDPEIESVVLECLRKDPDERPASIRDVRRRFMAAYAPQFDTDHDASTLSPNVIANALSAGQGSSTNWQDTAPYARSSAYTPLIVILTLLVAGGVAFVARSWFTKPMTVLSVTGRESLELIAGQSLPLSLNIDGPPGMGTARLQISDLPTGVDISIPEKAEAGFVEGQVSADLNAPAFDGHLTIVATAGNLTSEWPVKLRITSPPAWLPHTSRSIEPSGDLRDIEGQVFSENLDISVGDETIRFRLVDTRSTVGHYLPFYLSETKVWNNLYEIFENERQNSGNRKGVIGDDRLSEPKFPAFGMTANEAYEFARWLGGEEGNLPSVRQWWIAAGYFEKVKLPEFERGPFRLARTDRVPLEEVVHGPRSVGVSPMDESVHGIKDMGVGGFEWTSSIWPMLNAAPFPIPDTELDVSVCQVGCGLNSRRMTFDDAKPFFEPATGSFPPSSSPSKRWDDCGFRVVINPEGR